jgi:hypothetical protein
MPTPTIRHAVWSVAFAALAAVASAPAAAITTTVYDFITTRNGTSHFLDSFADGLAPPSAPNFANATPASYFVGGSFLGAESGGQLVVNSLNGLVGTNALGQASRTQRATLLTNPDPLNTVNGLKPNHTFTVSSLVDIAGATGSGSYAVRLSDRNDVGSVSYFASVEFIPSANSVRLRVQNFVTDQVLNLASVAIPVGADQVRLSLSHPQAGVATVYGSAEFFDDGASMGIFNVGNGASIFNYNGFVRAEFAAGETLPVPEPETYAMMLVGVGLVGWQLRRKAKAARAQHVG